MVHELRPLTAVAALAASFALLAPAVGAQGMPSNMIFFAPGTTCPNGSSPAPDAAGRMLLAVTNAGDVGKTYGSPLFDQEDRAHHHTGMMSVNLPTKSISGASGCCNTQATSKGNHGTGLTSGESTSGLPFIQLIVCQAD